MVLCVGCQVNARCDSCGAGVLSSPGLVASAAAPNEQRFDFFDSQILGPGTYQSPSFQRQANNLIVEAFPVGDPGTATAAVYDAASGAALTLATDSAAPGPPLSSYKKWMVRGVLGTVALKVTINSGQWSFFGAFTNEASTTARATFDERDMSLVTAFLGLLTDTVGTQSGNLLPVGSYTVPSGRAARVKTLGMQIQRTGVATTAGLAVFRPVMVTDAGLTHLSSMQVSLIPSTGNVAGAYAQLALPVDIPLTSGQSLQFFYASADSSDGQLTFAGDAFVFEFDA